jgi:hypothetical protein
VVVGEGVTKVASGTRNSPLGTFRRRAPPGGLSTQGRRALVVDQGEVDDDLVGDMTEVLTSLCARAQGEDKSMDMPTCSSTNCEDGTGVTGRARPPLPPSNRRLLEDVITFVHALSNGSEGELQAVRPHAGDA